MRAVFRVKLKQSLTCSKEFSLRVSVSPAAAAFVTQTTQRLIFCPTNRQTHLTRSTARVSMQLKKKTGSGWYFCKPPPKEHGVPNVTAASPCWQIRELWLMFVMSYTLHISSLWILWSSFCLVLFLCMWVINMLCGSSALYLQYSGSDEQLLLLSACLCFLALFILNSEGIIFLSVSFPSTIHTSPNSLPATILSPLSLFHLRPLAASFSSSVPTSRLLLSITPSICHFVAMFCTFGSIHF